MPSIFINVSITSSGGNAAGEVFVLTCSANVVGSADQPTITWLDSSSQAVVANRAAGARISVSATSMDSSGSYAKSLLFSPLVASDAGLFKCEVVLDGMTNNENVTVTVNGMLVLIGVLFYTAIIDTLVIMLLLLQILLFASVTVE